MINKIHEWLQKKWGDKDYYKDLAFWGVCVVCLIALCVVGLFIAFVAWSFTVHFIFGCVGIVLGLWLLAIALFKLAEEL